MEYEFEPKEIEIKRAEWGIVIRKEGLRHPAVVWRGGKAARETKGREAKEEPAV